MKVIYRLMIVILCGLFFLNSAPCPVYANAEKSIAIESTEENSVNANKGKSFSFQYDGSGVYAIVLDKDEEAGKKEDPDETPKQENIQTEAGNVSVTVQKGSTALSGVSIPLGLFEETVKDKYRSEKYTFVRAMLGDSLINGVWHDEDKGVYYVTTTGKEMKNTGGTK